MLRARLASMDPADAAFCLEQFDPDQILPFFVGLEPEHAGEVLTEFDVGFTQALIAELPLSRLQTIIDTLPPDDAVDVFKLLPHGTRIGILESVDKELASQIRMLSVYDENTAGALMTPQFVALDVSKSTADVIAEVKGTEKSETDHVFLVDRDNQLEGVVTVLDLLHEKDGAKPVRDLMESKVISVPADADREEVVRLATHYGLSTLPVVNQAQKLIGIITADDLDHAQEEEASEDIFRMAGTVARHPTKLPVQKRILLRMPTLIVTVLIGLFAAHILSALGGGGSSSSPLVSAMRYVLIVIAIAGNVGNISNAIVVRGLATSEIEIGHLLRPFWGELRVGIGIGITCAVLTFAGVGLLEGDWAHLPAVVATALMIAVSFSSATGFAIPLACEKLGIDPALAGPLVTAISDLAGTSVYVGVCLIALSPAA